MYEYEDMYDTFIPNDLLTINNPVVRKEFESNYKHYNIIIDNNEYSVFLNPDREYFISVVNGKIIDTPVDKIIDTPVDKIIDTPVDKIIDTPVDKIKEYILEYKDGNWVVSKYLDIYTKCYFICGRYVKKEQCGHCSKCNNYICMDRCINDEEMYDDNGNHIPLCWSCM